MSSQTRNLVVWSWILAPIPPIVLIFFNSFTWVVCPYSVCLMFLLYANHGFTSMVLPGVPELIVAFLQLPLYGWLVSRAAGKGTELRMLMKIGVWHFVAIGGAFLSREFLDYVWGMKA